MYHKRLNLSTLMIWNQNKAQLRELLIAQRACLSQAERLNAGECIGARIAATGLWHSAQKIASYASFKSEVDLSDLHQQAWLEKKELYLPMLRNSKLVFAPYHPNSSISLNQYNIREIDIDSNAVLTVAQLDLLLMPLVGFDQQGNRLGMGKGYYDKTLATISTLKRRPTLIGVAFSCQQVEKIPVDSWDIALDMIVTEKETLLCKA